MTDPLRDALTSEQAAAGPREVADLAKAVARTHPTARAVVHYGSTLRSGRWADELIDLYLLVDDYRAAFGHRWLAFANRWLPPNVFPFSHGGLRAKVAVLDWRDLERLCRAEAASVSVWARFGQPLRLAWSRDPAASGRVADAARESVLTMLRTAAPLARSGEPLAIWRTGLALTYRAELRAERGGRGDTVLDAAPERYRHMALLGADALGWPVSDESIGKRFTLQATKAERARWRRRQWAGKALTLARLAKASATYGGGIEYLADKIERHSGVPVQLKPWQRRRPILGALTLLPSLLRRGAVR